MQFLIFLDYLAVGKLNIKKTKKIIGGILRGCELSNCRLIGGETAEMPGIYTDDKFDLAGFSVGIVSKSKIIGKKKVKNNDIILAIPSSGVHSNGYSLIRSILKNRTISKKIKKELLRPTKIYSSEILKIVKKQLIHSSAHITGGGLIENLIRSVPEKFSVNLDLSKIRIKSIFKWIKKNNITDNEMMKTFNCGIGFCVIAPKKNIKKIQKCFTNEYKPYEIGYISKIGKKVNLINSLKW